MDGSRALFAATLALAVAGCGDRTPAKAAPVTAPGADAGLDAAVAVPQEIIDRTAATTALMQAWNEPDAVERLYAGAHARFKAKVSLDELRIFHEDFAAKVGAFVAVKSSQGVHHTTKDGQEEDVVRGLIAFAHGEAPYELVLSADGSPPAMVHFKLELPPTLQTPPDRAQARAQAAKVVDAILAVDLAKVDAASLPIIRGQLTADDATRMKAAVAALGGGRKTAVTKDEACSAAAHCLTYRVTGARGGATILLTLSAPLGRWRVANWNFEPDAAKDEAKKEMPTP